MVPVEFEISEHALHATGTLRLRQTDFGIDPFSVLGGALTVQDELALTFEVRADRVPASADGDVISAY